MFFLDLLAEQRIAEAERDGLLANLPGAGVPLDLDDDRLIPQDLRIAIGCSTASPTIIQTEGPET